ncbi:response regulator [Methylobacterium terricola]|uniref:Response regulator n=1 Tax=Methylobacterium terricola TaxID=2583531 RepID=A0A5C4LG59_9HYPH|nr:response regulator [Methylobacterium terricola]TNC11399.1 response regulator [Methylobacterium terricola]
MRAVRHEGGCGRAPVRTINTLLLEDDDVDAKLIALQAAGFRRLDMRVLRARSAVEARAHVEAERIDLAILDFWLGCESSLRFLAELDARLPGLPAVVLTGLSMPDVREMCLSAGAVRFLDKASLTSEAFEAAILGVLGPRIVRTPAAEPVRYGRPGLTVISNERCDR